MTTRRHLLCTALGIPVLWLSRAAPAAAVFEITLSDAEWRKRLSPAQFAVLRQQDTERPYSSPLLREKRRGTYACAGCDLPLFSSTAKFDSRTGWPSFWTCLPDSVAQRRDTSHGMDRIEVHCRRCGGHQGHLFDDGPRPTGLRYCINGLALKFIPTDT